MTPEPAGPSSTGDTYVVDADGYYACLGRTGDMLKASGIWVAPAEVESRLLDHADVAQAVVVAAADADGLEKPVAFVQLNPDGLADEETLIGFCRTGLPSFKRPRRIVFVTEYPTTATGKIRRVELRAQAAAILQAASEQAGAAARPQGAAVTAWTGQRRSRSSAPAPWAAASRRSPRWPATRSRCTTPSRAPPSGRSPRSATGSPGWSPRAASAPTALRLAVATELGDLASARCVIEAVAEDLAVKQALFADLEKVVTPDCVLATNTSSLSPTAIAAGLSHPERLVGLHFFNPAPVMRLVEVVSGLATDPGVAAAVTRLAEGWGKQVVQAAATPGFIVNRVARPFYAEALRLAEEQAAGPATIDAVLTQAGGFRMGPFALMDLVGQDVNEAVTQSVWTAFGYDPRFAPSLLQRALVEAGWLGRKSGRGWYRYGDDAPPPVPDVAPSRPWPAGGEVTEHGVSPLRTLLSRSGVGIRAGAGARRNGRATEWRAAGALRRQARDRAGEGPAGRRGRPHAR